MRKIREIAKRVPGVLWLYRAMLRLSDALGLRNSDIEEVFTRIFTENRWRGKDSLSGPGSGLYQTRVIMKELPLLMRDLKVSTFLDIPCGDFHWMRDVDLKGVKYTGGDVVKGLIGQNREKYGGENVRFQHLNLVSDKIPEVDLIFCRDCLVHFSFDDIFAALRNICSSRSGYLLTTTFTARTQNHDILTGQWRPLNLEVAPFNLPRPLRIINEDYTDEGGAFRDKSLGLWRIEDIAKGLASRH